MILGHVPGCKPCLTVESKKREAIIQRLLAHKREIREVILYESADWACFLPVTDPHAYLEVPAEK